MRDIARRPFNSMFAIPIIDTVFKQDAAAVGVDVDAMVVWPDFSRIK